MESGIEALETLMLQTVVITSLASTAQTNISHPLSVCRPPCLSLAGINKREAKDCHHIPHFENTFVVETVICDEAEEEEGRLSVSSPTICRCGPGDLHSQTLALMDPHVQTPCGFLTVPPTG